MVYSTDASKWRAYQFLDPFAAGSFFVCNKITSNFCRPDCDAHPITELHLEIKFVDTAEEAVDLGFTPCKFCNPMQVPVVDVDLLLLTVREINAMIGFVPPLVEEDEDKVTEKIKENIMGHNNVQRRMLVPANAYSSKNNNVKASSYAVSKNDSEHYRLIDLACRHLALAAAVSIFTPAGNESGASSPKSDGLSLSQKKRSGRKRRGGVLGFKELAIKSKLSAWHFHRVFKSIIGLTPKTYGDMCWEFLEKEKEAMDAGEVRKPAAVVFEASSSASTRSSTPVIKEEMEEPALQDAYLTPPQAPVVSSPASGQKRRASAEDLMPSTKRATYTSPQLGSFNNLKLEDDMEQTGLAPRATSVPNLSSFSAAPNSLFQHLRNFDFFVSRDDMPSTEEVFSAGGLPYKYGLQDGLSDHIQDTQSVAFSSGILPATIDDISPLNGLAMISPELVPNNDMSFSLGEPLQNTGFTLAVDQIKEEELFPSMEMFPDLFKTKNEYPTDYNLNDPLVSGLAPELLSSIDY